MTQYNSNDPYEMIQDVFRMFSLAQYRKLIGSMLKAAYSDDYWKRSDPGTLLFFHDEMQELITAGWLLKTASIQRDEQAKVVIRIIDRGQDVDPASYFGNHRGDGIWEYFPRNLTRKEFANPYLVLDKFFRRKTKVQWEQDMKSILTYALSRYGKDSGAALDYLGIHQLLQKLVEAAHLISLRRNANNNAREGAKHNNDPEDGMEESKGISADDAS